MKEKTSASKATSKKKSLTCLEAIEKINSIMMHSKLTKTAIKQANAAMNALAELQNISPEEAMILSAIIEVGAVYVINFNTLADFFCCSNVQMYLYRPTIQSLIEKGFLRMYDGQNTEARYRPSNGLMTALFENRQFQGVDYKNLDLENFLLEFMNLADERKYEKLEYELFIADVVRYIKSNNHLPLCQMIEGYGFLNYSTDHSLVLFILKASANMVLFNRKCSSQHECEKLVNDDVDYNILNGALNYYSSNKAKEKFFEPYITPENPYALSEQFNLTSDFCKKYLGGRIVPKTTTHLQCVDGFMNHKNIQKKQLFYNREEETQLTELSQLLTPCNFKRIQRELKSHGYRKGFACLFYGAPGTGKTESVMQLAKTTGRDIIKVDLSQIRDKYIGESEKNTKEIFDNYRNVLRASKKAPILLLNEADGLLAKRFSSINHSSEQMENTMQNIILQEMESFEGIMIATTNLTCNLDSAFERRFLYKVEFHKPSIEARQSIWSSMIRDLTPDEANAMATEFDFTGGEIENIARKYVVGNILHNEQTNIDSLRNICRSERLSKSNSRKVIGF